MKTNNGGIDVKVCISDCWDIKEIADISGSSIEPDRSVHVFWKIDDRQITCKDIKSINSLCDIVTLRNSDFAIRLSARFDLTKSRYFREKINIFFHEHFLVQKHCRCSFVSHLLFPTCFKSFLVTS